MFCEHCGNKNDGSHKFCTKCGQPTSKEAIIEPTSNLNLDQKWWLRLAKVIYIMLHIPLPLILWIVWQANSSSYDYSAQASTDTSGTAFWYSLLALAIYMVVVRLIKITFLYIAFAQKVQWKKEFKKFF